MATGISALAPELLRQCLKHLPRNDVAKNTPLVSREWLTISRDISWGNAQLRIEDDAVRLLAPVLNEGTSIPRRIKAFFIDESDDIDYREHGDEEKWQDGFCKVMDHFEAVNNLTIGCLDLSKFPAERSGSLLRDVSVTKALVVQWLKVASVSEAAEFLLNQPDISFLGIGNVVVPKKEDSVDEVEKTPESRIGQDVAINLGNVRHLVLFAGASSIVWKHLVPLIARASLTELKTLVVESHDTPALLQLITTAGPALRSLAFSFADSGTADPINLAPARSLMNLSIFMAEYPMREHLLASTAAAITTAPRNIEHVVLAIGPGLLEPEKQPDDAPTHWAALDTALIALPNLTKVVLLIVFPQCYAMFAGSSVGMGEQMNEINQAALDGVREKLPLRAAAGEDAIEVRGVFGGWSSNAFAGISLPE